MSHILVFEPDTEGHPREWLEHLVTFAGHASQSDAVTFVVAAEMCAHLQAILPQSAANRLRVVPLGPTELRLCTRRFLTLAAFARWWVVRRYLRLTGADAGHFLSFDHLCVPLALGLGMGGKPVSGILFRPSVHYATLGAYRPKLAERLRDVRKSCLYRLMLLNGSVRTVLSLDPYFPQYAARRYRGGDKVRMIPDPAFPSMSGDSGARETPSSNRIGFILFGYLTERKGLLVLLDALEQLDTDIASRMSVTIAGRVDPALRSQVSERVQQIRDRQPDLHLVVHDQWIAAAELEALVGASDVILAPYQRFVGSSGVLLWAARAGLPILTQDFGLLDRLVRDHGLGLAADTTRPDRLAAGIACMITDGPRRFIDPQSARAFVTGRTPHDFASAVVQSLQPGDLH